MNIEMGDIQGGMTGTYYKLEKQLKNGPRKFYQLEWMRNNDGYVTTEIQMPESCLDYPS